MKQLTLFVVLFLCLHCVEAKTQALFCRVKRYDNSTSVYVITFITISSDKWEAGDKSILLSDLEKSLKISSEHKKHINLFPEKVYLTEIGIITSPAYFMLTIDKNKCPRKKNGNTYLSCITGNFRMLDKNQGVLTYNLSHKRKVKINNISAIKENKVTGNITFDIGKLYFLSGLSSNKLP